MRLDLGVPIIRVCTAFAMVAWLGCADDNGSPIAPSSVKPNAPAGNASDPSVALGASVGGSSLGSVPGAVPEGSFRPSGPPNVVSVVAALDAPPRPPGSLSGGADGHHGFAGQSGLGTVTVPEIGPTPGAGSEEQLGAPPTPRSNVSHSSCFVAGPDAADLKSTAPEPVSPKDVATAEARPSLTAHIAEGAFVTADFGYRFALYKVVGGQRTEVEVGCGGPVVGTLTSYRSRMPLDLQASYVWRVRAFLDGAYGPWSEDASFRTVGVRFGAPRPLVPREGSTVPTSTNFTVRNPTVEGSPDRVTIEVQVATDSSFTSNVTTGRTHMRDRGETDIGLSGALQPRTRYYWRARASASPGSGGNVVGPWSAPVSFRTAAFQISAPQPIAPRNGAVDVPIRPRPGNPQFTVRNATVPGGSGTVNLLVQVSRDRTFAGTVAEGETHQRPRGETNVWIDRALAPETLYYWRVRAQLASNPSVVSDWSAVWRFTTAGTVDTGPTTAPGRGECCPPRNRFDIVQAVLGRTGNLYRQDIQQFTQRVAECLAATDGDWGRRRNDSGAIGKDTVAYRTSKGPGRGPFSIDIMLGASGNDPRPHWVVQSHDGIDGRVGGTWLSVDGSNCILGGAR